jgi:hypothetical protein
MENTHPNDTVADVDGTSSAAVDTVVIKVSGEERKVDARIGTVHDDPRISDTVDHRSKALAKRGKGMNTESFDPASTLVRPVSGGVGDAFGTREAGVRGCPRSPFCTRRLCRGDARVVRRPIPLPSVLAVSRISPAHLPLVLWPHFSRRRCGSSWAQTAHRTAAS